MGGDLRTTMTLVQTYYPIGLLTLLDGEHAARSQTDAASPVDKSFDAPSGYAALTVEDTVGFSEIGAKNIIRYVI